MEWGSPDRRSAPDLGGPEPAGLSAKHIREACEASLTRLKTDYIDLYQMHHVDRDTRWRNLAGDEVLVAQGKGSTWLVQLRRLHIAQAQESARSRHFLGWRRNRASTT